MKDLFKILSLIFPLFALFSGILGVDKKRRDDLEEKREHEDHMKDIRDVICFIFGIVLSCGLVLILKKHADDKKRLGFRI